MTCELVRNIRALRKPVIASLNGTTAGAGACIALASDLRIASTEARIAFLFVKVGLSGADMGAAHLLPRLVGLSKATELLYTGDFVTAEEALNIGLYNRVVPAPELESATRSLAERLARGPSFALGVTKEMLNRELDVSLDTALELEAAAQAVCMRHPDYAEAYRAFTEKREPRFHDEPTDRE
jgi:enoyl-CoA hydratase/carnithine racemase